jgi:hypothetical protein
LRTDHQNQLRGRKPAKSDIIKVSQYNSSNPKRERERESLSFHCSASPFSKDKENIQKAVDGNDIYVEQSILEYIVVDDDDAVDVCQEYCCKKPKKSTFQTRRAAASCLCIYVPFDQ